MLQLLLQRRLVWGTVIFQKLLLFPSPPLVRIQYTWFGQLQSKHQRLITAQTWHVCKRAKYFVQQQSGLPPRCQSIAPQRSVLQVREAKPKRTSSGTTAMHTRDNPSHPSDGTVPRHALQRPYTMKINGFSHLALLPGVGNIITGSLFRGILQAPAARPIADQLHTVTQIWCLQREFVGTANTAAGYLP